MRISSNGMLLGIVTKDAGVTKDGTAYEGYTALHYVLEGEVQSRSYYVRKDDNEDLWRKLLSMDDTWGTPIYITGDIDFKGRVSVESVEGV